MAHDITNDTAFAYIGKPAWHGLGKELPVGTNDWDTIRQTVGFYDARKEDIFLGNGRKVEGRQALVRCDTGDALGSVVTPEYEVIQFQQQFEALMVAGKLFGATFECGGLLGRTGAEGFMVATLPGQVKVAGDTSEFRKYLLAHSGHTGKHPLSLRNVHERTVCRNTLGTAFGEKGNFRATIRHTSNASQRIADATAAFESMIRGSAEFERIANELAAQQFSDVQFKATLDVMLPLPAERPTAQLLNKRDAVMTAWDSSPGMAGIRGTAWGALQAWTYWADHGQSFRGADKNARQLESVWFGKAADISAGAFQAIQAQLAA
jgi:phage/plasmid-like protein (TIGR03299 family)